MAYTNFQERKQLAKEFNETFTSAIKKYGIESAYIHNGIAYIDAQKELPDEIRESIENWLFDNTPCRF